MRKTGCSSFFFDDLYHEAFALLLSREKDGQEAVRFPYTYIIRTCKNLWIKEQKRQSVHILQDIMDHYQCREEESRSDIICLLVNHVKKLSVGCRQILILYSLGYSEDKISKTLNLGSKKAAKNKKYYCKEKLYNMMINDPQFEELYG